MKPNGETRRPRALDLFCGQGGASWGLYLAGFDVVGVDINHQPRYPANHDAEHAQHFEFNQSDALAYPLDGFDFICASPPCQAHTSLRALHPDREYPDLIPATRERLRSQPAPWCIENVPGAPLGGWNLIMLCGSMFGLETPDGRAFIKRHRLFELSFSIPLRPACQCSRGHQEALSVCGTGLDSNRERWAKRKALTAVGANGLPGLSHERLEATIAGKAPERKRVICSGGGKAMSGGMAESQGMRKRRAMSVTGNTPQTNTERNAVRETFGIDDARAAMGCPWMNMRGLSQAIPPAYYKFIGEQAIEVIR